jgi:hypothetical protein
MLNKYDAQNNPYNNYPATKGNSTEVENFRT